MSSLNNTPWKYEAHADGTCDIYATDKRRETGLRWIGAAIDEPTARAIAALPDTLAELEKVKKERDELKEFVKLFVKTQQETYGNGIKTHLSMATLSEKAQQLLTTKSE